MTFLDFTFYQNTVQSWLIAALVAVLAYVALRLIHRFLKRQVRVFADRTSNHLDDIMADALDRTRRFFLVALSLYAGSRLLVLPGDRGLGWVIRLLVVVAFLLQGGIWGSAVIHTLLARQLKERGEEDAATATTINALGIVARIALWSLLLLVGLDNMGIDVTALVTGLGIGGVAVALAVQNVLKDLFASLSIVLDRPFVMGDFIIVGDLLGTVEHIGLKTTRVRSLSGEQLVFSNADLLDSRIRNFKRMFERRVVFTVGVIYQTPKAQLEQIPGYIRGIVESIEKTRFDRSHFKGFGASSLDFETVYYVLDSDYNVYMDIQQEINLQLFGRFTEEGIEFAYPTQTLFVEGASAEASP